MDSDDFHKLLDKVENAFRQSDIKVYCDVNNLKWFYAICSTSITIGAPLIVGFNWGAANGKDYEPQTSLPQERFIDLK